MFSLTLPRHSGFEQRDNWTKMNLTVGIGAGLVSALLFAAVITGSPLALLLSYVAPVPIFIAALGWRHQAGLVATLAGAAAIAIGLKLSAGLTFVIGVALPSWWIAYLAMLGRSEMLPDGRELTQWFPVGRLMMWIAAVSGLITLAGAVAIAGDYEAYLDVMRKTLRTVIGGGFPGVATTADVANGGGSNAQITPRGADLDSFINSLAVYVPVVAGASFMPMISANLWLAAKVTQMSGRLIRPWPILPNTQMPREAVFMLAFALLGFMLLPGFAGLACGALFGALGTAFFFTGLATIHAMTWGRPWRSLALGALYFALFIILGLALPVLALFGVCDSLFNLRNTQALPPSSTTPPATT